MASPHPKKPVECNFIRYGLDRMNWECDMKMSRGRCDGKRCILQKIFKMGLV